MMVEGGDQITLFRAVGFSKGTKQRRFAKA